MAALKGLAKTLLKLALFLPVLFFMVCLNYNVDVSGLFQGDQFERELAQKLHEGEAISHFEKLDERQILRLVDEGDAANREGRALSREEFETIRAVDIPPVPRRAKPSHTDFRPGFY